jgi:hypothetical protein
MVDDKVHVNGCKVKLNRKKGLEVNLKNPCRDEKHAAIPTCHKATACISNGCTPT